MIASDSESDQGVTPPTFSPTQKPVPVGHNDQSAQRDWEHFQVQRGIDRYRRSLVTESKSGTIRSKDLGETTHGQRIATELIGPMVEAVEKFQKDFADQLNEQGSKMKRLPEAATVITTLSAETIAACAILTALANPVDAGWTSVRVSCAARLRHEIEYQEWAKAEKAAEKARKQTGEEGINLFKLMLKRNDGEIDKRVFDKWSKKSVLMIKQEWDQRTKVLIGDAVMSLVVESNGWFKVDDVLEDGAKFPKKVFGMTETALKLTAALGHSCELQRPFLAPMICEPQDYQPQVVNIAQ